MPSTPIHRPIGESAPAPAERPLTARERDILGMLLHGKRNREISERLSITERTVKFHVGGVLAKLGASNRTEAVKIALERGLVTLSLPGS
jgi:DNA-binding NarL/FixJ family response regulator